MTSLAEPVAPRATARATDIDIARGLAIILVVAGHALIGVERATGETPAGRLVLIVIYAIHMPIFFFLSGLLARSSVTEPLEGFVHRLAVRFAWPYVLWSLILLSFHHGFSDLTNTQPAHFNPIRILWAPPSVMWFLYVLAASLVVGRCLRALPAEATRFVGGALIVAGSSLDVWLLPHLRFMGLFLIATTLDAAEIRAMAASPAARALAALALGTGIIFAAADARVPLVGYPAAQACYLPASAGGILLALAFGRAFSRSLPGIALASLGRRTMPIFVMHILILAAIRIVLLRAGIDAPVTLLIVLVPAGTLLPLAAADIAARLGASRLLGWS